MSACRPPRLRQVHLEQSIHLRSKQLLKAVAESSGSSRFLAEGAQRVALPSCLRHHAVVVAPRVVRQLEEVEQLLGRKAVEPVEQAAGDQVAAPTT